MVKNIYANHCTIVHFLVEGDHTLYTGQCTVATPKHWAFVPSDHSSSVAYQLAHLPFLAKDDLKVELKDSSSTVFIQCLF